MNPIEPEAAHRLYTAVWPWLSEGIRVAESWGPLGADWFGVSTPFVERDDQGRIVAHVGVVCCDWWVHGAPRGVWAVHAVCVHPEHRGRGLARSALERALAWIEEQAPGAPVVLWSDLAELYGKFGFRPLREHVFEGELSSSGEAVRARRLAMEDPRDLSLLADALRTRRPVSDVIAAADSGWHFGIVLALWTAAAGTDAAPRLALLEEHEALVVGLIQSDTLCLYDVIAPGALPGLDAAAAALVSVCGGGAEPRHLRVCFSPDRLPGAERLTAVPHPDEDFLMVRGEGLGISVPFALSPLTRT